MSFNTADFNRTAAGFLAKYAVERDDLEKCLAGHVNDDVNFVCQEPKQAYLTGVAKTFCEIEYEDIKRCQEDNPKQHGAICFSRMVKFGQCTDGALRKLYIYGLEQHKKNPKAFKG